MVKRLEFEVTNNQAEYEALIIGLKLTAHLEAKNLKVFTDSQLVVGQTTHKLVHPDTHAAVCLRVGAFGVERDTRLGLGTKGQGRVEQSHGIRPAFRTVSGGDGEGAEGTSSQWRESGGM